MVFTNVDLTTSSLIRYAEDGIYYLLTYSPQESYSQADFAASEAVSKLVCLVAEREASIFRSLLLGLSVEVCSQLW